MNMNTTLPSPDKTSGDAEWYYLKLFNQRKEEASYADESMKFFYPRLQPAVYTQVRSLLKDRPEVDEITNDCFINTWRSEWKCDRPSALKAYLLRTARNKSLNELKKSRRHTFLPLPEELQADPPKDQEREDKRDTMIHEVLAEVEKLPPAQKKMIDELFLKERKNQDFARENNLPENRVGSKKFKLLGQLRKKLTRKDKK